MNNRLSFYSVDEIKQEIFHHFADSEIENAIIKFLSSSEKESIWPCIEFLLMHEKSKIRSLGLRVVRRFARETALLENVVELSFDIERLAELQHWYAAILARYPLNSFGNKICVEIRKRADADFAKRNIRALEMYRANGIDRKLKVLQKMKKCANEIVPNGQ